MTQRQSGNSRAAARADKVERLVRFILEGLDVCQDGEGSGRAIACRVIAKSPDSAVVEALTAARVRVGARKLQMLAIFASEGADHGWTGGIDGDEVAVLPAGGLMEAHERLILGSAIMWTGDTLRRDLDKRDAHEIVEGPNTDTVTWAMRSFDRLWERADPILITPAPVAATVSAQDVIVDFVRSRQSSGAES